MKRGAEEAVSVRAAVPEELNPLRIPGAPSERRFPDFLVVGAAKSGTSTLYHHLRAHPGIYMPELKEPWFFAFAERPEEARLERPRARLPASLEAYLELFAPAGVDQVLGEASTVYLYLYERTIANLKRLHPGWKGLKILVLLRDPVDRAWSHYKHALRDGRERGSFADAVERWERGEAPPLRDYLRYGMYCAQVGAYLSEFPAVRVYLFDELKRRPREVVGDAFSFLGLRPHVGIDPALRANPSGAPRSRTLMRWLRDRGPVKSLLKPVLSAPTRARLKSWATRSLVRDVSPEPDANRRLRELFRDDIRCLEALIGRDLSHWLED